ncbi:hypothetical protein VB796_00530 [Arcicella sp. LKC2W]|uniref:hypothetical protein n=1 Tax=Arcicella sp. LKC2W TaxID=2984198 RepID=UPI002B213C7F|nr:hypothetical protein [Arcicella sp. LKC2W]MEA5457502.1 hypothetical protein [Arcicella sp. LKC2W]
MNYRKSFKSVWRVDIIVSLSAMLICLATFGIYLYQTKIIQEQAKASVYPHLEIVREYKFTKIIGWSKSGNNQKNVKTVKMKI